MKYRSTVATSRLILFTLLDKKEYAQYDMPKEIGKDYRTILRHLRILENEGLIHLVREERSKKQGKERKIHGLTKLGLIEILHAIADYSDEKDFEECLKDTANKHKELLPLILGKMQFFEEHNIKSVILERFKNALRQAPYTLDKYVSDGSMKEMEPLIEEFTGQASASALADAKKEYKKRVNEVEEAHRMIREGRSDVDEHGLYVQVFFEFPMGEEDKQRQVLSVLSKDKDFCQFINAELKRMEKKYEADLRTFQNVKDAWTHVRLKN